MKLSKVGIITDEKRKIDYESIIEFQEKDFINIDNMMYDILQAYDVVIVDIYDESAVVNICTKIRKISNKPIIIMSDVFNPISENIIEKIHGIGTTKIFHYKNENKIRFFDVIQSCTNPLIDSTSKKIAVILPVYNEEERFLNVKKFFENLHKNLINTDLNMSIYFINDGSTDKTEKLVRQLVEVGINEDFVIRNNPVVVDKNLSINTRKAGTYIEAMKTIDADIYIFSDADNSFNVEDIFRIINILEDGYYDIVAATKDRTAEKRPFIRRVMSYFKRIITRPLLPKGIYDSQTGLKGLNKLSVKYILPYLSIKSGLAIDLELLYTAKNKKFRVIQLPVNCIDIEGSHVRIIKDSIHFLKIVMKIMFKKR